MVYIARILDIIHYAQYEHAALILIQNIDARHMVVCMGHCLSTASDKVSMVLVCCLMFSPLVPQRPLLSVTPNKIRDQKVTKKILKFENQNQLQER